MRPGFSVGTFTTDAPSSDLHLVTIPRLSFPLEIHEYVNGPVPSLQDFEQLWLAWDVVTRQMTLEKEMLSKPINLRNCCLFYLGHIPTFLDIHLTRATGGAPTAPTTYRDIFERGIDPDVEDPKRCHAHSEIPDEWPSLGEILQYQARVRQRARSIYTVIAAKNDRRTDRALWIGFEHEGQMQHMMC